ncbi:hypothetical protein CEK71_18805 [Methylovulum psychrotolerans]|uniref:Uncharacterized protein n=3 Tax=Methylovulum psychrotolerans TaxID=1704499 RepID=A0A1Z4C355_9GAMM|nr:hypothetical protein CEK71_18805 [Methylovulum psychrotolerans]
MIMPTKIIQPVDSLIVIGSCVLKLLAEHGQLSVDDLLDKVNKTYHKPISIDKLLLCLNFLYLINKVESHHAIIKAKI